MACRCAKCGEFTEDDPCGKCDRSQGFIGNDEDGPHTYLGVVVLLVTIVILFCGQWKT